MPGWQERLDNWQKTWPEQWQPNALWRRLALAVAFALVLALILISSDPADRIRVAPGEPAPRTITAPRDFVDFPRTEELRQAAAEAVPDVYRHDPSVADTVLQTVSDDFRAIWKTRGDLELDREEKIDALMATLEFDLPREVYGAIIDAPDDRLLAMERDLKGVMAREMARNISPSDRETFQQEAEAFIRQSGYGPAANDFLVALARERLQPNFFLDTVQTTANKDAAREAVEPVVIQRDQVLIREGDPVMQDDVRRLRDAGVLAEGVNYSAPLGSLALAVLITTILGAYLYYFNRPIYDRESYLVLLGLIMLVTVLLARLAAPISGLLAPIAGGTMLLTILLNPMAAIVVGMLTGLMAGVLADFDLLVVLTGILGGLAGIFVVTKVNQRGDIMRASFIVALVNVATITSLNMVLGNQSFSDFSIWRDNLFGIVNGVVLSGFLTMGLLPYAENLFGILTSMKLLELSNPNQPLLRRLLLEAPGTYHHSLMVSNLAEAGVEAVGGNALLTRVAAYYHDVGKLKRPYFFIENQFGGENPHDKVSPNLSALIITAHVKEGIEMARQAGLPQTIIDFIPEHHGTTLVKYFYSRALENAKEGETVEEANFRHEGPKPQSKEAAVLMLADSCEATVRALQNPTPGKIEAAVRKIIRERLDDGQLDESDLTLRDLDTIAHTFTHMLTGIFHQRVEYPETFIKEVQRQGGQGRDGSGQRRQRA